MLLFDAISIFLFCLLSSLFSLPPFFFQLAQFLVTSFLNLLTKIVVSSIDYFGFWFEKDFAVLQLSLPFSPFSVLFFFSASTIGVIFNLLLQSLFILSGSFGMFCFFLGVPFSKIVECIFYCFLV